MKARYRYRAYPTDSQKTALAQLFGCCRVVWNDALAFCQESYEKGEKYLGESELQKRFITAAKKNEDREWLKDVSNIPLQQSIQDLGQAFSNFFNSVKGKKRANKLDYLGSRNAVLTNLLGLELVDLKYIPKRFLYPK